METIKIEISRCLYDYGYKPYIPICYSHKIKRGWDRFTTLKELKNYYGITSIKKTDKTEWAISSRGKRHEWPVYEAEISKEFAL